MPADSVGWVTPQALGGAAEMLLAGQRQDEIELVDQGLNPMDSDDLAEYQSRC